MKTTIKITALAVIAVLLALSCVPQAELSDVDWKEVNTKYNAGKNTSGGMPDANTPIVDPSFYFFTGADEVNELDLTFPVSSDFLRNGSESKVESGLRRFLSFYHFTPAVAPVYGKADTLVNPALTYKYIRRNGNVITVRMDKKFVATDSSVIVKIDGTKYTFANGNKLDFVGKGKGGQAGYDDYYQEISVYGADGPTSFTEPGDKGWSLTLNRIFTAPTYAIEKTLSDPIIATLSLPGADSDIAQRVADQVKSGLKIQKFTNESWGNVSAKISYYPGTPGSGRFEIDGSLTLKDFDRYRVMWEGSAPVTTSADYYGVKQYIKIVGVNTPNGPYSYNSWKPAYYKTGKVYGSGSYSWYNDYEGYRFGAPAPSILNVSKDARSRNVIIEVEFPRVRYGSNTYWLKNFNTDKQTFKKNFKIAYYDGYDDYYYGGADNFTSRDDVVYIDIKDFEFFSYNPEKEAEVGINAIRITLDPNYQNDYKTKYFYISDVIRYTDDKTTFGSASNYLHGWFKAYSAGSFYN